MNNYLLRSIKGEKDLLENIPCLSEIDVNTQDKVWCFAGLEHGLNPFGKLPIRNQTQTINKKMVKYLFINIENIVMGFLLV